MPAMIIRPLFNPNDDEWAVMIGRYILNTGSVYMSTRRLIALLDRHSAGVVMRFWRDLNLPSAAISFYKGGFIDELNKIVYVRGDFVREVTVDEHRAFW